MHTHIHVYAHLHTNVLMYMCAYTLNYPHVHVYAYIHPAVHMCFCTYIHIHNCTHMHVYIHTSAVHTYMNRCAHTAALMDCSKIQEQHLSDSVARTQQT